MNITMSPTIGNLAKALAAAQADLPAAVKNATNPAFGNDYADLNSHLETALPVLSRHGLALMQIPGNDGGAVSLTTILAHVSGEFVQGHASMTPQKPGPHAFGSCLTYLRRYSLAVYGASQVDDDANSAQGIAGKGVDIDGAKAQLMSCKTHDEASELWQKMDKATRSAISAVDPQFLSALKAKFAEAA